MKRESPIAGTWYEGNKAKLSNQINELFQNSQFGPNISIEKIEMKLDGDKLIGVISPHAGYVYSGSIAAWSYKSLKENRSNLDTCIILGPNHRGLGPSISIYPNGVWKFPNCELRIDNEIIKFLETKVKSENFDEIYFETTAHSIEHSIDIQIPILGEIYGSDLQIIPICIRDQTIENSKLLSQLIFEIIEQFSDKSIAVVASSDLSHEENYEKLMKNDEMIIEKILDGDPLTMNVARSNNKVTMCGYGPILTLLMLTGKFGQVHVISNKYANSKQIKPGGSYTVGYLSASCFVI